MIFWSNVGDKCKSEVQLLFELIAICPSSCVEQGAANYCTVQRSTLVNSLIRFLLHNLTYTAPVVSVIEVFVVSNAVSI